jgi:hypothetical protein
MNTPAHAIINLFLLGRKEPGKKVVPILIGAVLPDIAIFAMYFWHLIIGTPESVIWSVEYYKPGWQAFIDCFNSIPLLLFGMVVCWKSKQHFLFILFASMLLHTFGDLPFHHDDAHRHFFPFTDWRFSSPVSYWNPNYHGNWFSIIEGLSVLATSIFLYFHYPKLRVWVICIGLTYLAFLGYVELFWKG